MITDTNIILGTLGRYAIARAMHEVDLRDGTLHQLHRVRLLGDGQLYSKCLRGIQDPAGYWLVFDVRDIAACLVQDLQIQPDRDHNGCVKYALRCNFSGGSDLRAAILSHHMAYGPLTPAAAPALEADAS